MTSSPTLRVIVFLLFTFSSCRITYAQSPAQMPTMIDQSKQVLFDKIIDYILDQKFLIKFSDFSSGHIQYIIINRSAGKILSAKEGERYVVNIFLRKVNDNKTYIRHQVNVEDLFYKNYVLYSVDKGVTSDQNIYKKFVDNLIRHLNER